MGRLRYLDIQNSRIPAQLGVCRDSDELLAWTCMFEQRAIAYGRWWGSTQLMQFCVTSDECGGVCIVAPRQVATIEAANLRGASVGIQNTWGQFVRPHLAVGQGCCGCGTSASATTNQFLINADTGEFISNPDTGSLITVEGAVSMTTSAQVVCGCGCGCRTLPPMYDEGMVATFSVTREGDRIKLYPTQAADVGKKVVVQGTDSNGVWVRTSIDGVVQDGEQVVLAIGGTLTATTWAAGQPVAAFKEATAYRVLMFAVDEDDNERQLADYEPSETNPSYRKFKLPTVRCATNQTFRAIASLQPGVIQHSNDWLLFADALPAYAEGLAAEKLRENFDYGAADAAYFGTPKAARNRRGVLSSSVGMGVIPFLESLLRKQTGDRTSVSVKRDGLVLAGFV